MRTAICGFSRLGARAGIVVVLILAANSACHAQILTNQRSVGGVSIDASGVVQNATQDDLGALAQLRADAMQRIPDDLKTAAPLRKVSLRRLEAAIAESKKTGKPLPDAIKYLAGLQRIQYLFVYPDDHDIVLLGPAEGWKVDKRGNVVGVHSGRPVLLLDDLLVALRSAKQAAQGGISCSIDPTAEGLTRLQGFAKTLGSLSGGQQAQEVASGIEQVLGVQRISVSGVPGTSHFARVLVAADYRMKRIAMAFEPAPVKGLPSFLQMMTASGRGLNNMLPRWWLEPRYDALLRDPAGLAWELRGSSVKAMTEEDFLAANGNREHTGKPNPMAQKWADTMTAKYGELSVAEPIFGQLQNCMDLAVVGALIVKERLAEKAGHSLPVLMDTATVKADEFPAPKSTNSQASVLKKGHNWVISASGGVLINSWAITDKTQASDTATQVRTKATAGGKTAWWWD